MKNEITKLARLAGPIALGQISQTLFGFIDTLMIGHVGTTELAASSFANSVFVVFLVFGIGLTNSTTPLISRAVGRTDFHGARGILKHSLWVNIIGGSILTLLCLSCLFFFDRLGQTPEVVHYAKQFFILISLTLVPALIYQVLKQYLECLAKPVVPMLTAFGGLLINIGLNFIFIFGHGPIPAMGVAGAALGTICARLIMVAFLAGYVRWERTHRKFQTEPNPFAPLTRDEVVKELIGLGIPTGFIVTFEVGAFASAAVIVGWMGSVSLAAHQITISLASLTFMVPMGIAVAASIRVGHELGRNDYFAAKRAAIAALLCAAGFMAATALVFLVGRAFLPSLFTKDAAVIQIASSLLIVAALFQISDGVQVVGAGILRSLKDVRWPLAITFSAYWILALPIGYVLAFPLKLGPVGIWLGLFIGLVLAAFALTIRFFKLLAAQAALANTATANAKN